MRDHFVHSTKFDASILVRSMGCARRPHDVLGFLRSGRGRPRRPSECSPAPPWRGCCEEHSSQSNGCHAFGAVHVEAGGGFHGPLPGACASRCCSLMYRRPCICWASTSFDDVLRCSRFASTLCHTVHTAYGCSETVPRRSPQQPQLISTWPAIQVVLGACSVGVL